jgi:arylsulfatase A-like enzyme
VPLPNVVVFLADDAGWGDYGHSGNQAAATPHIDRLAAGGVSLDNFLVCPLCAPTRAEFLTGRYYPRTGVQGVSSGWERMDLDERTVADAFHAAGYATGAFGKWHNGTQWPYHPLARGFDAYLGHTAGHWGEYFNAPLDDQGQMVRTQGYIVDVCTDRALEFIDEHRAHPFFCFIPFTTPHTPWAAPAGNWERFRGRPISQRATRPDQERLEETRCALAMLENQDENVGRVLTKLEQLDLAERTIVVYFSDNGPNSWRWNGGLKGRKASLDEGGVRSVCFLRWPNQFAAGRRVPQLCGAIDLLPTLTSLAGIARAGELPLDGVDLSPLLKGFAQDWPDRMLFTTLGGRTSVRTQQYRLDADGELFDLEADPGQQTPLAQRLPDVTARLSQAVADWNAAILPGPSGPRGEVDPRPIPVGYPEFPLTMLPARDGTPHGGVRRSSSAPNCSYFVNWRSPDDRLSWRVDVQTAGLYAVTIDYTCPLADAGALVELQCGTRRLQGVVAPGWDPPMYDDQDTLPRPPAESSMKEFRPLTLGQLRLDAGLAELSLQARRIPGETVMDVRRVNLTLLAPQ